MYSEEGSGTATGDVDAISHADDPGFSAPTMPNHEFVGVAGHNPGRLPGLRFVSHTIPDGGPEV